MGRGYVIEHCMSALRDLTKRWAELIDTQKEEKKKPEDNRPAAEIAHDIWKRIRGE